MSDYRYELIVYWSAQDAVFVVEVPELPGCTAHGCTQAEALGHAQEAIALWLGAAREAGRAIPKPRGRRLTPA